MAALPLVYACSGCSSAAQTANAAALRLDRRGIAEMSCIAGVGGNVAPLVRLARGGRTIVALDGCALACVRACLAQHGITADHYVPLQGLGVRKRFHADYDDAEVERVVQHVAQQLRGAGHGAQPPEPAAVTARGGP
ncbi:putative metal-binding protein [Pseudoduganella flava]|uniref:Putative metal-binding protein n=1 Tax=Pseudoduganella flava TaxID=871742 RepID=A0A562PCW1_9BURK|nr:putative zinc-binding protein [Pseudoduganella flava]QGZ38004.1 zinc-binding protein [Pseudoduganella flava]TWI41826.1 putative metal-binding protein [Pseudoduganella flava]